MWAALFHSSMLTSAMMSMLESWEEDMVEETRVVDVVKVMSKR